MKCFETFRTIDPESGVENWRAYFTDDCSPNQVGDWMPKSDAPVGRGDSELEAIAVLCLLVDGLPNLKTDVHVNIEQPSKLSKWEIWLEGYAAIGEQDYAICVGIYEAETFREAVHKAVHDKLTISLFDPVKLTHWGRRFFDNETDARKG